MSSYRVDYSTAPLASLWVYRSKEGNAFYALPGKPYKEGVITPWPPQVGQWLRLAGMRIVPKRVIEVESYEQQ